MNQYNKGTPNCNAVRMLLLNFRQEVRVHQAATLIFGPSNFNDPEDKASSPQEADFRLVIISEDLTWFRLVRPGFVTGGAYSVTLIFPFEGNYILFADFRSKRHPSITDKLKLYVKGALPPKSEGMMEKLVFSSGDLQMKIITEQAFRTETQNKIAVTIRKNGVPLRATDLTSCLGAMAHIILVRRNDKSFQHLHSEADENYPVIGRILFSRPGIYRMWIQFQTGNQLYTADFTLNVAESNAQ